MASITNMKNRIRKAIGAKTTDEVTKESLPSGIIAEAVFTFIEQDDITAPQPASVLLWQRVAEICERKAREAESKKAEKKEPKS